MMFPLYPYRYFWSGILPQTSKTVQVRWMIEQMEAEKNQDVPIYGEKMPDWYNLTGFPVFDEKYREPLLRKIFGHYYMKYIGFETIALFKNRFEQRMSEIMLYYNQLYKSELLDFDPFVTNDWSRTIKDNSQRNGTNTETKERNTTETNTNTVESTITDNGTTKGTRKENGTNTLESTDSNTSRQINSDTPQTVLGGHDYASYLIDKEDSLHHNENGSNNSNGETSETRNNTSDANGTSTDNNKGTENITGDIRTTDDYMREFEEHVHGNTSEKSTPLLLQDFRNTFLNIDMMIIEELADLFITIY